MKNSWVFTKDLLKKIWLYVVIGIAIGGIMHGWVPLGVLAKYAGRDNTFAVFVAVVIGIVGVGIIITGYLFNYILV